MATLVLTVAGSVIGGPEGGAIGAIVGQRVDAVLFRPKARQGPRLGDLSVQTSSYGTPIPRIFGTMRIAGTVIWATDLQEHSTTTGPKTGPRTVSYSYSASFAVALSGRRVREVRRIWAEGKLLRGAAGDFKTPVTFRFHDGCEDQPPDALIAAAEGSDGASAFPGIAYAVFENLQLADFGNRIPSLTFEIDADEGPVGLGAIAEEISEGEVRDGGTESVQGYAVSGDSVRSAVEALADAAPAWFSDIGTHLEMRSSSAPAAVIFPPEETQARPQERGDARTEIARKPYDVVPSDVTIGYYDVARDYQLGLQRARRPGAGLRQDSHALPAVLAAGEAAAFAEARLRALAAARSTATLRLPARRLGVGPGAIVRIAGESPTWRVQRWMFERFAVELELIAIPASASARSAPALPGRAVSAPDLRAGETKLVLAELPSMTDAADAPRLVALAAGTEAGWRGTGLSLSLDGGSSWAAPARTVAPAVIGGATTALGPADSTLLDTANVLEVELANESMWLESRDQESLVPSENIAILGQELLQFASAEPLGERRFRLTRLLRGRFGTEWAAVSHQAGEPFALLDQATVTPLDIGRDKVGAEAIVVAEGGVGPAEAPLASCRIEGEAMRPPSVVHLRGERLPNGDIALSWARRSRAGWDWGEVETPVAEEQERYRLTLTGAAGTRTAMIEAPSFLYSAADQAQDGASGAVSAQVVQLGTYAASRLATLTIA